jgi:hypothetical protein
VPKFTKACCIITSKTKKEDLVSKALASCSNTMIQPGKEALSASKSTDDLLEGAVSFFKRDMEHSPDFFGLIFETWWAVRRSKRIKKNSMLELISQRPTDVKKVIETAAKKGVIGVRDPVELEGLARILLRCIMVLHFN